MRIVGPESEFMCGFDAAAKQDAEEFKRLDKRIEELEIALRAALSFMQERHKDLNDGHAAMVIAAVRGALRKVRD